MKKTLFVFIMSLFFNFTYSQFPGKKTKTPYIGVDGHTYKVGDEITVGFASKGDNFQSIFIYDYEDALEQSAKILDALNGEQLENSKVKVADKSINQFKGKILFFKVLESDKFLKCTYAILSYDDKQRLAVAIDVSLKKRELVSVNSEYNDAFLKNTTADFNSDEMNVKSFNSNFNVKVLSVIGNKDEQTVKINFLISHKLPHQLVDLRANPSGFSGGQGKLYDFNGNIYDAKTVAIGVNESGNSVSDKIPTNVPVKASITFKQILPDVKEFSFMTLGVYYGAFDGFSREEDDLEINNLKVDWK
jgi:hypothetical protein